MAKEEEKEALKKGKVSNSFFDKSLERNEKIKTTFLGRLFDLFTRILGKSKPAENETKKKEEVSELEGTKCPMFDKEKFGNNKVQKTNKLQKLFPKTTRVLAPLACAFPSLGKRKERKGPKM